MDELISRQVAIDALEIDKAELNRIIRRMSANDAQLDHYVAQHNQVVYDIDAITQLPPIQPEPHEIGYKECANALLKMWMDNVLTDGEYYRIADKLNKKWGKREVTE